MPHPRPRTAFPTAAAVAAQGLTVDQVDPDHLSFLQLVRPDGNSYAVELPARGASPPVTVRYESGTAAANGEAQIVPAPSPAPPGSDRVVEKEIPPADALQWYETATMDEDYRKFWRQTRIENGLLVLQVGEDKVLRYTVDAEPVRLSDIADGAQKKGGEEVAAVAALGEDGDGVGEEKKKVEAIRTDVPVLEPRVRDSPARWQKMVVPGQKVEQGQEEKGEVKCGAEKIKVVKGEDKMLNELSVGTLNTVNTETNFSTGHDSKAHIASPENRKPQLRRSPRLVLRLPENGILWCCMAYTYYGEASIILQEKLLRDLRRPCCLEEYERLLREASDRLPATKRRQTRRGVKYYNSSHETNKSYFDSHPDLEKQVRSTSYPNQLALLRGFFFWLKNVTDEDQFRPWRDDFRQYSIIPRE